VHKLLKTDGQARRGYFETGHGIFQTPNFMPVGTKASVKGIDCQRLREAGTEITLVNTYHLWLRPGPELIQELGGIHKFASWGGPILSDSGGFQVFSLNSLRKLEEAGVTFSSHLDGTKMFLSPEKSIEIQEMLGVDIAMAFDECPPGDLPHDKVKQSLELTYRWAERSVAARKVPEKTKLFGIAQGGIFKDLRTKAAEMVSSLPFDGYAIGGLSVGEKKEDMYDVLSYHPQQLPADKIRYVMGVGTPEDIVEAVNNGVDLFDCVMPTRSGRFGRAFISGDEPYINMRGSRFKKDLRPLDENCSCIACQRYSRAYIHHLFQVEEMLGPTMLSLHNVTFFLTHLAKIRAAIETGSFGSYYSLIKEQWRKVTLGKNK